MPQAVSCWYGKSGYRSSGPASTLDNHAVRLQTQRSWPFPPHYVNNIDRRAQSERRTTWACSQVFRDGISPTWLFVGSARAFKAPWLMYTEIEAGAFSTIPRPPRHFTCLCRTHDVGAPRYCLCTEYLFLPRIIPDSLSPGHVQRKESSGLSVGGTPISSGIFPSEVGE